MLDGLIAERLADTDAEPQDLLAVMVRNVGKDGWSLSPHHARTLAVNVLAGSLSASYMLGNLFYRFLSDPDFAQTLRDDRSLIPAAVEESLRFEAPVLFLFRTAREETEIGGCPVHAGEHIMLGIASAGRDERAYPDAGEFRLDRTGEPEHLAFGAGPHICLGNHLTRMVGRVALEEILDIFPPARSSSLRISNGSASPTSSNTDPTASTSSSSRTEGPARSSDVAVVACARHPAPVPPTRR